MKKVYREYTDTPFWGLMDDNASRKMRKNTPVREGIWSFWIPDPYMATPEMRRVCVVYASYISHIQG